MKKTTRILTSLAAVSALALAACGGDGGSTGAEGESVTLHMATMVQPQTPNAPVQNWFLDELESRSEGRIKIDRTEPETICPAPEIAECVKDGRADIGISISDYTPQLFPMMTLVSVPFMVDNSQALMQSLAKVNDENESAKAAWDKAGLKLIGAWGPGKLILGTNQRVQDIEDIKGMKFRVTGPFLQQAFESAGANVVALPAAETYEAVERGIADAVAWTMDGPVDYKLMEQLSTWTDPGVGHYTTFAIWMNQAKYDSMPADLQKIVDDVRADLNAGEGMKAFQTKTVEQCDALQAFPKTESFTAWDEAATAEWRDSVQAEMLAKWEEQAKRDGLSDPASFLADYQAAIEAAGAEDLLEDPVAACIAQMNG
ncbi:MAG: TRAP transporter substrate-binding protein DctP [Propionibacteriaceae bacterium]|nr:TRAP transporter substrate-binding protein DctP [Propionibacteriaceae bacterium]